MNTTTPMGEKSGVQRGSSAIMPRTAKLSLFHLSPWWVPVRLPKVYVEIQAVQCFRLYWEVEH